MALNQDVSSLKKEKQLTEEEFMISGLLGILILIAGLACLVKGGDWLVDGSVSIAKHFNVPEIVIGLTLVAFGTSAPELLVNIFAAIDGNGDIAFGNIIGSNIVNIGLILGVSLLFRDLVIKKTTTAFEVPLVILSALMVLILASDMWLDGRTIVELSRSEGGILLLFFIIFMIYNGFLAKQEGFEAEEDIKVVSLPWAIVFFITGLVLLIVGGKLTVTGAVSTARALGIPERLIALTIVAVGTSLPEMAASIAAARKGSSDIAVGNILGSNLFNVFFILGISGLIRPIGISAGIQRDIAFNLVFPLVVWILMLAGKGKISKKSGSILIVMYALYILQLGILK
ncbi:calcium/sodium antiporter [Thermospira aquatica]|uniref:Calcium/sodium antiporter n=1 Tax=Thermospira aquatica TaxID=2828656 RepID=A0AAX3BDX8_9SPIR|nr:calcium/sodium antiporter [Thermospira aquatica]URA10440.1 calcium/sodium antiporter [Thermospira aquatica]